MAQLINWSKTFSYAGLSLPIFGEYGGVGYSNGDLGGTPVTTGNRKNPYLSYEQLLVPDDAAANPVNLMDYSFYRHDVALMLAGGNTKKQAAADAALLEALVAYEPDQDLANDTPEEVAESSLYEGATIFAMLYRLADANQLGLISPTLLIAAVNDAISSIEDGVAALDGIPADLPDGSPFGVAGELVYYQFDAGVLTETQEALVIGAAALSLNDPGDPIPFTFITDDYAITYNRTTGDVDITTAGWLLS